MRIMDGTAVTSLNADLRTHPAACFTAPRFVGVYCTVCLTPDTAYVVVQLWVLSDESSANKFAANITCAVLDTESHKCI